MIFVHGWFKSTAESENLLRAVGFRWKIILYKKYLYIGLALRGRGYFAECGLQNAESCQRGNLRKMKCGTFRKLPLVAFPHSAAEKFRISADRKTTVRSHCTTDVQPMHTILRSLETWKKWKMVYWIQQLNAGLYMKRNIKTRTYNTELQYTCHSQCTVILLIWDCEVFQTDDMIWLWYCRVF